MKVYYAHSMHLYGKPQEKRDIELLQKLGFEVINPSEKEYCDQCAYLKANGHGDTIMEYFKEIIDSCDVVAFRSHPDGKIPSGVGVEVKHAINTKKPVFELPTLINSRFMELGETRQYLELLGER